MKLFDDNDKFIGTPAQAQAYDLSSQALVVCHALPQTSKDEIVKNLDTMDRTLAALRIAALAVLCFALILMAWYGVNFVLGTGLHSYGFGGGGQVYVLAAVAVQFLYVGVATLMVAYKEQPQATPTPL